MSPPQRDVEPAAYTELLEQIKTEVRGARIQTARKINTEMIVLYWRIGHTILERQNEQGWGSKVISRLANDLAAEFPNTRGFSRRNLEYMRRLAATFPEPIAQQPAAQLPWGHLMCSLTKLLSQPHGTGTSPQPSPTAGHGRH